MRFPEFWQLYLRAHQRPGTRALHYFATVFGILSVAEAVVDRQPLFLILGVAVGYGLAIGAHWFIEGNQPLIRVNAFWGVIAGLRMCWLAMTGRLAGELSRTPIASSVPSGHSNAGSVVDEIAAHGPHDNLPRYALLLASASGLGASLMELRDLFDPTDIPPYPTIEIGAPIVAFLGALILASAALGLAPHGATLSVRGDAWSTPNDPSLKRATLTLLAFGLATYGLAELFEPGFDSPHLFEAWTVLIALVCIGGVLLWPLFAKGPA